MQCIKTGCHAYIENYGEHLYGDLYKHNGTYLMRVCHISRDPILTSEVHCLFREGSSPMQWFDKDKTSQEQNSTLVFIDTIGSVVFDYKGFTLS